MKDVLVALAALGCLVASAVPAVAQQRAGADSGRPGDASPAGSARLPEGRLYVSTCEPGQEHDYRYCNGMDDGILGSGVLQEERQRPPDIFVTTGGGSMERVTDNEMFEYSSSLVWSPDGSRFAIAASPYGDGEECRAYVVEARTGSMFPITPEAELACPRPTDWSPDGKWILMAVSFHDGPTNIYKVRPDGLGLQDLTCFWSEGQYASNARWVDDGRSVVFEFDGFNRNGIFEVSAQGGHQNPLFTVRGRGRRSVYVRDTVVSPNRRRVAFVVYDGSKATHRPDEVFVMDVDGGNRRRLTFNSRDEMALSWAPDNRRLAMVVGNAYERDGFGAIKIVNVLSGRSNVVKVPKQGHLDPWGGLVWSPSGRHLAFTVEKEDGTSAIFVGSRRGSHLRRVTSFDAITRLEDWRW